MAIFIVTIKEPKKPGHDPRNKQIGKCKWSEYCTDVTGEHHSFIEHGHTADEIRTKYVSRGIHVTRIEMACEYPTIPDA